MLNLDLAEGVRRVGFRKWYERELLTSHAHMILAVLAVIGMLGSFEGMRGDVSADQRTINVAFVILSAAIGLWALRRYLFLLTRAEEIANQASCESCGEYGRFKVMRAQGAFDTDVSCSKCEHRWHIGLGAED
jgi:ABC-type nickel/cobalt efflux system permease component RcnA